VVAVRDRATGKVLGGTETGRQTPRIIVRLARARAMPNTNIVLSLDVFRLCRLRWTSFSWSQFRSRPSCGTVYSTRSLDLVLWPRWQP